MKRNNKKGFTIVELVIVIAVIAILSSVLIPTFSGITTKAQNSKRDQQAKNDFTNYLIETNAVVGEGDYFLSGTYYYPVSNGQIDLEHEVDTLPNGKTVINAPATGDGE